MKLSDELIRQIEAEEISILVCMNGTKSSLPDLKVELGTCINCQGVVHYDILNREPIKARGLKFVCFECFLSTSKAREWGCGGGLVGGQMLDPEDAFKAVDEMANPKPPEKQS